MCLERLTIAIYSVRSIIVRFVIVLDITLQPDRDVHRDRRRKVSGLQLGEVDMTDISLRKENKKYSGALIGEKF